MKLVNQTAEIYTYISKHSADTNTS